MKKVIIRTAAAALLVGGLLFNFGLNSINSNNELDSLAVIANVSVAQAEDGTYPCMYGCYANGQGCLCNYWWPDYLIPHQ